MLIRGKKLRFRRKFVDIAQEKADIFGRIILWLNNIYREKAFGAILQRNLKYVLEEIFGDADLLPVWVADMEIQSPPSVREALQKRV